MTDEKKVPQEIIDLYEGKSNVVVDSFCGCFGANEATSQLEWTILMMDFGGSIHRQHKFTDRDVYLKTIQFLLDCGLVRAMPA
jgi:hypothetical protein